MHKPSRNKANPQVKIDLTAIANTLEPGDKILTPADCNHIHFGGNHTILTPAQLTSIPT